MNTGFQVCHILGMHPDQLEYIEFHLPLLQT